LPTKLSKRKTSVLKARYDQVVINLLAKKLKSHVFPRKGFRKPKKIDIELISLEKQYDCYLILKGKYSIDHCKSLIYELEVEKNADKVFLLNETLRPEPYSATNSDLYDTIKLTGVASFHYENEARYIIDNRGQEFDSKELDNVLNEQWHKEKLIKSELRKTISKLKITPEKEVNFIKNKLVKRPQNTGEVIKEILEINERKIYYIPMYQLNFKNKKTKNEAVIRINGITGKIVLTTFSNKVLPIKLIEEVNKECHKIIKPAIQKPVKASHVTKYNKNPPKIKPKLKEEIRKTKSNTKNITDSKLAKKKSEPTPVPIKPENKSSNKKSEDLKPTRSSEPEPNSEKPEIKIEIEDLEFPAKVSGDVFYVGDKLTAIVGDIEIPSGTTVYDTLVVKGNLIIGKKCKMLATIKALGNIMIGADTIIKGNVISYQKVSLGPRVNIQGEVIIKKNLCSQLTTS